MSNNMETMFKIFDPVVIGPYPGYEPEVVERAIHLLNDLRMGKKIEHTIESEKSIEFLLRASIRVHLKLKHFISRSRGLNIVPDTHAPKDVVDHIIYSIMVNDAATNLPYDMFYVKNQDPTIVAASLRQALIVVEGYIKMLDIKNK